MAARRRWLHSLIVLVCLTGGCRSGTRTPSEDSVAPSALVASPTPEPGDTANEPDAASPETSPAPVAVREPPPLQEGHPIEWPFAAKSIVVMPMTDSTPVVLFTDEKAPLRRKVASFLKRRRHPVVPPAELHRIEEAAAQGRLVLEGDRQCRSALTHHELIERYFAKAAKADVDGSCYDGCYLQIAVETPADDGDADGDSYFGFISSAVRKPHDPRAWAAVRFRPTEGLGGVVGGSMMSSHPPPIMFGLVSSIGPWGTAPDRELLESQADVARCAHPDPKPRFDWEVRLAIASSGRMARCEATSDDHRARPEDALCLCEGFASVRFDKGGSGRRLRVTATDTGAFTTSAMHWAPLQPGTEVWVDRLTRAFVLDTCLAEGSPEGSFSPTVVMSLEPDGSITNVEVFGEVQTSAQMKFSACLVRELPQVALPCAPPGIDTLQVEIRPGTRED